MIRVKELDYEHSQWFVETAAVNMLVYEVRRPELVNIKNLYNLALQGIKDRTAWVAFKEDIPVGALGSLLLPNVFNPELASLAEVFWYVLPEYRRGRAGLLLLDVFDECGKQRAYDSTLSLLDSSEVNDKTLARRGFYLAEKGYRKEY